MQMADTTYWVMSNSLFSLIISLLQTKSIGKIMVEFIFLYESKTYICGKFYQKPKNKK